MDIIIITGILSIGGIILYIARMLWRAQKDNQDEGLAIDLSDMRVLTIDELGKVIGLNPGMTEAYIRRGDLYSRSNQVELALKDFSEAIRLAPESRETAEAYSNRGALYVAAQQHQKAFDDLGKAISLDPENAEAYYSRGKNHQALDCHKEAIEDFDMAIRLAPRHAAAFIGRGTSYLRMEDYRRAIEDFDEALHLRPNDQLAAQAHYRRGLAHMETGEGEDQALDDFNDAFLFDPAVLQHSRSAMADKTEMGRRRKTRGN